MTMLLSLLTSVVARADEQWILTTADFKSETVSLKSIDDGGVHLPGDGGADRTIPMTQFLQLDRVGRTRSTPPKMFLWLTDGDHLGGAPVAISGESLTWRCPNFGDVAFPLSRIRSIQKPSQPAPSNDVNRTEDVLSLANGDSLHGILSDITASAMTIQPTGGEAASVPLAAIVSADFAAPPGTTSAPAKLQRGFRVSTSDGTVITTESVQLSQRDLHIHLAGADRAIPLSSLAGIEQVNGPVIWLSAITPIENTQIPAFSQHTQPAQMDRNVNGDPIRFNDREFTHGIGAHSYSKLVFPIDPTCKTFRTQFAIDGDQPWADVTVRILLDDKVALERPHVIAGALSDVVKLDLAGAKTLTLEVDYGENYDVQDRLNWIEPAMVR
jgi:NPCBM/NEW2 domain-containing protein